MPAYIFMHTLTPILAPPLQTPPSTVFVHGVRAFEDFIEQKVPASFRDLGLGLGFRV